MSESTNIDKLTAAGIIPEGYEKMSAAEEATVNSMSDAEIEAIISASSKVDPEFLKKHAPHGMSY